MMNVQINTQFNLLIETAYLVFAWANRMPPTVLTSDKPYCIPVQEVQCIMDAVCGDLDPQDRRLRFYFQSFSVDGIKNASVFETCAGVIFINSALREGDCDLKKSRENMHSHFIGSSCYYEINSFNANGIGANACEEYRSIAEELGRFDMPDGLRLRLLEVLSNFHRNVDELCNLLEPLCEKLLPLLLPWWEKMTPRLEQWKDLLSTEMGVQEMLWDVTIDTREVKTLKLSLHIFRPAVRRICMDFGGGTLYKDIGLDFQPIKVKREGFTAVELSALRLLSSADRIEMLRAMSDQVMTPKELTERLRLNSGSVFRDLASLFQAHLVEMVVEEGIHRSYRTAVDYLESLVTQLLQYIKKEEV